MRKSQNDLKEKSNYGKKKSNSEQKVKFEIPCAPCMATCFCKSPCNRIINIFYSLQALVGPHKMKSRAGFGPRALSLTPLLYCHPIRLLPLFPRGIYIPPSLQAPFMHRLRLYRSTHLLMTENPPTYFYRTLNAVKETHNNPSINLSPRPRQTSAQSGSQLSPLTFRRPPFNASWEAAETPIFP